jgi:hypothetical protein
LNHKKSTFISEDNAHFITSIYQLPAATPRAQLYAPPHRPNANNNASKNLTAKRHTPDRTKLHPSKT